MWILEWIPDIVINLLTVVGILGIAAGFLLKSIPIINKYHAPLLFVSIVLSCYMLWLQGGISQRNYYEQKIVELEKKILESERLAEEATGKVEIKYVDRVRTIVETQYKVIGSIRDNSPGIDSMCEFPAIVNELHNEAAIGEQDDK